MTIDMIPYWTEIPVVPSLVGPKVSCMCMRLVIAALCPYGPTCAVLIGIICRDGGSISDDDDAPLSKHFQGQQPRIGSALGKAHETASSEEG